MDLKKILQIEDTINYIIVATTTLLPIGVLIINIFLLVQVANGIAELTPNVDSSRIVFFIILGSILGMLYPVAKGRYINNEEKDGTHELTSKEKLNLLYILIAIVFMHLTTISYIVWMLFQLQELDYQAFYWTMANQVSGIVCDFIVGSTSSTLIEKVYVEKWKKEAEAKKELERLAKKKEEADKKKKLEEEEEKRKKGVITINDSINDRNSSKKTV